MDRTSVVTGTCAVTVVVRCFCESMYFTAFFTHGFVGSAHTLLPSTVVKLKQGTLINYKCSDKMYIFYPIYLFHIVYFIFTVHNIIRFITLISFVWVCVNYSCKKLTQQPSLGRLQPPAYGSLWLRPGGVLFWKSSDSSLWVCLLVTKTKTFHYIRKKHNHKYPTTIKVINKPIITISSFNSQSSKW